MPTFAERYGQGKMMGLWMLEERRRKQLQEAELRRLTERRGEDYMPVPIGKLAEMGMPLDQFMPQATITPGGATVPMQMGAIDRLMKLLPKKEKILTGEALWHSQNPGKTHEDYLRATKGITAEFKRPTQPSEAQKKSKRELEYERLKTKKEREGQASLGPKDWETYRLGEMEFAKKPTKWTTELEKLYQNRDPKTQRHLGREQWRQLSQIGKPISQLPNAKTIEQKGYIDADLTEEKDPIAKGRKVQEMKDALGTEGEILRESGVDVEYLLKYLNSLKF